MLHDAEVLALEDLKSTVFVRRVLNEDRVLQLMELYRSNDCDIPPIEVVRDTLEIQDGRHRREALLRLGRKNILCKLVKPVEKPEFLMRAFAANVGGPFAPTRGDIIFVMKQLFGDGLREARIREMFAPHFPPSVTRAYLTDARSELYQQSLRNAVSAVTSENMTVAQAAEKFGLDLEKLQDEIGGRKRKGRKINATAIKANISNLARSTSTRNVSSFRDLLRRYEDSEVSHAIVLEVLLHAKRLHIDGAKRIDSWLERLEALKKSKG